MSAASILIKPASANCNMDCKYCFYKCLSSQRTEYSKGFMSEETLEMLVMQAIDYAEGSLTFAFQGGEPTLCGIDFYRRAVELEKKYNKKNLIIANTLQTNGLLIDEEWAKFFSENHFLVGLSLDGPRKVHDKYRTGIDGTGTFYSIMHTTELFDRYHVDYNILSVVTDEAAKRASYIYNFFRKRGFSFLQFIPCMDEKSRYAQGEKTVFSVTPEQYGSFLCQLFDLWYEDYCQGADIEIRMFSNLAQMAAGYPAEECGMNGRCTCYFVVEGDGSVYPCDFYCTDTWKLGMVENSFQTLAQSVKAKQFVEESLCQHEKCTHCPYFSLCRGGCRRWREQSDQGKPGLNELCPAYEMFFGYAGDRINKLGELIKRRYR
ncbi:MAG: anaerobic sulfatase maturase [Clostridiaceae bacterium]|nr:anaerobic sulfatase maturase [Clostridiaceae bacterium]